MEEKKPMAPGENAGGNASHHNRHHRNFHHKNNKQGEKSPQQTQNGATSTQKKSQQRPSQKQHRKNGKPQESRIYNPYELNKEEQYLADLRAKIVVKSADEVAVEAPQKVAEPEEIDSTLLDRLNERDAKQATPTGDLVEVVGIRFRSVGKTYYFDPGKLTAKQGDFAIVETARGPEFGEVVLGNCKVPKENTVSPLRPMLRIATRDDILRNEANCIKEQEALEICRKMIPEHGLEMKIAEVQYAFDNSKLLFYFTSDGRVDFRELVKDLAATFHTRIELRQIGIRDEAKLLGGIGACGRLLCCSTFLPDFAQVSIKMAKEQNLSLNSAKISGVCGRLMCCLRFESDTYAEEIRRTPPVDSTVKTPDGIGKIISTSPLAGTVRVLFTDGQDTTQKQYSRDDVTVLSAGRKKADGKNSETDSAE